MQGLASTAAPEMGANSADDLAMKLPTTREESSTKTGAETVGTSSFKRATAAILGSVGDSLRMRLSCQPQWGVQVTDTISGSTNTELRAILECMGAIGRAIAAPSVLRGCTGQLPGLLKAAEAAVEETSSKHGICIEKVFGLRGWNLAEAPEAHSSLEKNKPSTPIYVRGNTHTPSRTQ